MSTATTPEISPRQKRLRVLWMLIGVVGIFVVLYRVMGPSPRGASARVTDPVVPEEPRQIVEVYPDGTIGLMMDSSFGERLETMSLSPRRLTDPLLTVSGIVVARVQSGPGDLAERWQFDTPELTASYSQWRRSLSEVEFSRNILEKTTELVKTEATFLAEQLQRLESVAKTGAASERELRAARADLLKAQIQGQRDIFSAQSALRVAENGRLALERELSQQGVEPMAFNRGVEHMVLVSANVPEAKVSLVREGQRCRVRFYAHPERTFDGHVETLGAMVTRELRTRRVLFDLNDPDRLLIPGMFAEVELGTDERESLTVPASAVIHVGHHDYVLVESSAGRWRAQVVRLGEFRRGEYEVLAGLAEKQVIISRGTVLLKPKLVEALDRMTGE